MSEKEDLLSGLVLELRRGTLVLSVLSQLASPRYGYALVQGLQSQGVTIDVGTLYPLLRRLEKQGLLQSEWETSQAKPRKYYVRTPYGTDVYNSLCAQWSRMAHSVDQMIREGGEKREPNE